METGEAGVARRVGGLAWDLYQQVAAVLAAFGLAALLGHVLDLGWRGLLETLVGYWAEYVRPVTGWILDTVVARPLAWAFGWEIRFLPAFQDYLSVVVITAFSMLREARRTSSPVEHAKNVLASPVAIVYLITLWPFVMLYLVAVALGAEGDVSRTGALRILAPLFYLGLLLAVNALVLR